MIKNLAYALMIIFTIIACEEIYIPNLKNVEDQLVVEAILLSGKEENDIFLYKSKNFNSDPNIPYPVVSGAIVNLVDDRGIRRKLVEKNKGTYRLSGLLDNKRRYYLSIETGGEVYKSVVQSVPATPDIDSIYGRFDYKTTTKGAVNSENDVVTKYGLQIYTDIDFNGDLNHYRFTGRKIIEYRTFYDTLVDETTPIPNPQPGDPKPVLTPVSRPIYIWQTFYPSGSFNIAGPPRYSAEKNIKEHRLEFFNQNYYEIIADTQEFVGWIYIIEQLGISEKAYNYYSDLNSQMEAQGKIFDPIYIQAEGNISCTSDPEKMVLGNFEIESYKQHRYLLKYNTINEKFSIQKLNRYGPIPTKGFIRDIQPDFWEK